MQTPLNIIVDTREPDSLVALLSQMGVNVERKQVTPGDYIVTDECAVERKTVNDYMNSLFQGRLMEQMIRLKEAYKRPLLIIEGNLAYELEGRKNPRAFWGSLLSIELDMGIPAVVTTHIGQTAEALYTLLKRLQTERKRRISPRHKPPIMTETEQQIFIVAGLPSIGEELAERLLTHLGSVRAVFQASKSQLTQVEGIGEVKAARITKLLDSRFGLEEAQ